MDVIPCKDLRSGFGWELRLHAKESPAAKKQAVMLNDDAKVVMEKAVCLVTKPTAVCPRFVVSHKLVGPSIIEGFTDASRGLFPFQKIG